MKEKEFTLKLLTNDPSAHRYYDEYKKDFIAYAVRNFQIDSDDAMDIFQESFVKLYKNLRDGKYEDRDKSLKDYLFGIGKNHILKYLEKKGRNHQMIQSLSSEWISENTVDMDWKISMEVARGLVHEIEGSCGKVLRLYYFENKRMSEIATAMEYGSEQVAKNKKSSCVHKLSLVLKARLNDLGIYWRNKK